MLKKRTALLLILLLLPAACAAAAPYEDGVYRDMAPGYNDEVIVTVVVRDGMMTALTAQNRSGGEKSEYFVKAEEGLAAAILEKQSLDGVDAVAGATGTSESILTAMKGVLEQMAYTGADTATAAPEGTPDATGTPASPEPTAASTGT